MYNVSVFLRPTVVDVSFPGPQGPPGPAGSGGGGGVATVIALPDQNGGYWSPSIIAVVNNAPVITWTYTPTLPSGASTVVQLSFGGTTWQQSVIGVVNNAPIIQWVPV